MKVLVLGSGAREHALGWALARRRDTRLWFAPGNAGTEALGSNLAEVDPRDPSAVVTASARNDVDLVVVGPEEPLERGVADLLRSAGIPVFGPSQGAARLETSKAFSKAFMERHAVPTATCLLFEDFDSYRRHVVGAEVPLVVKKSGLAAGKGVLVGADVPAMLEFGQEVLETDVLLVEERLEGYELSVFVLMDGREYLLLPPCADHKKAHDEDAGPNTGGMGAVCPVPRVEGETWERIRREAVEPTIDGLRADGLMYPGVLFLGLMVTAAGPRVLEYNVRFGDPEAQVLIPAMDADWPGMLEAAASGGLAGVAAPTVTRSCVGVVLASPGYPGAYPKAIPVRIGPEPGDDVFLFHASTSRGADGIVRTGGGRCFTVVGRGASIAAARERAYAALDMVGFDGAWCRRDIGVKYLD